MPELEDLGAEAEPAAVGGHVAEVGQGVQHPTGGGAGQLGAPCHVGQGEVGVLGVEHADHGQPADQ